MKRSIAALALIALLGTSCSNLHGSHSEQVGEWASAASYDMNNAQIQSDLGYLQAAERTHQFKAFQADCEGFSGDVESIYESLPTPDTALTNELNDASQDWFNASADCDNAKSVTSPSYTAAVGAIASGRRVYDTATKRLAALGVR